MSEAGREEMYEIGRAAGRASTRDQAEAIIAGLIGTIKMVREESGYDSPIASSLFAAIEGIKSTMTGEDASVS
jgi:hypothetical protein